MRLHTAIISIDQLRLYLEQHGRSIDTKDYELYAALLLTNFHAKQYGGNYLIALPAKRGRLKEEKIDIDFSQLLTERIEEDSPIDFAIVPEKDVVNCRYKPPKGWAYQLKRCIVKDENTEEEIVKFLEVISKKYSATEATLVLLLEHLDMTDRRFSLTKVNQLFQPKKFPFGRVLFVAGNQSENALTLGELWPRVGMSIYPYKDLLGNL
jgi:hypothetical protein